jgi:predicted ATPase
MRRLTQITVRGYKSIKDQTLDLRRLNVLIGGNGVGKSNLISVFGFLRRIYDGELQTYVATTGGSNGILHFGRKVTSKITVQVAFADEGSTFSNAYRLDLQPTDQDLLVFQAEKAGFQNSATHDSPYWESLGAGHSESSLKTSNSKIKGWVTDDLASYRVYHFHDTSANALVKQTGDINDNRFLQSDARNLAAYLYWMKLKYPVQLQLIEDVIRQIAPFFDRFELSPSRNNEDKIRLEWREKGSEAYFNAHQLSDGTLRFICLVTLLLQPELPRMVLLDEPELGLHPAAINLLTELLQQAALKTQLFVSTQSVTLVNQLQPEDVWVADRINGATEFKHLAQEDLSEWTGSYALGELWEKNIIGGRP